jgi:hypothetical protein
MSDEERYVSASDISEIGELIPAGNEFWARAIKIEPKETKTKEDGSGGGTWYTSVTFRVLDGPYEGLEPSKPYFITVSKGRNGKYYSQAKEMMKEMAKLGKPWPTDFKFPMKGHTTKADAERVGQALHDRLKSTVTPRLRMKTLAERARKQDENGKWADAFDDEGKPLYNVRYVILGTGDGSETSMLAGVTPPAAPAEAAKPASSLDLL